MGYDFLEALGVFESAFGRVWGCLGQAWGVLGRPWRHHIASWMHFGSVLKDFGGVLRPSGCVLEGLEGVWRVPEQAQDSFEEGLKRFLRGFLGLFDVFWYFATSAAKIDNEIIFLYENVNFMQKPCQGAYNKILEKPRKN